MPTPSDKPLFSRYLANALNTFGPASEATVVIIEWMYDFPSLLGFEPPHVKAITDSFSCMTIDKKHVKTIWPVILKKTNQWHEKCKNHPQPPAYRTLNYLADFYSLTTIEHDILTLAYLFTSNKAFEKLCDSLEQYGFKHEAILSAFLGVSPQKIIFNLSNKTILIQEQLVQRSSKLFIMSSSIGVQISDSLRDLFNQPVRNINEITQHLVGKPVGSDLCWKDFEHIVEQRDYIADLIKGGITSAEQGINILIYGAPGTGKTELCKVISKKLGIKLFSVGENDEDGDEASRSKRLSITRISQRLLSRQKNVAILFDEMEDILSSPAMNLLGLLTGQSDGNSGSKVFQNRLLETNSVPTFWTTNCISSMDIAYLRRMTYILELTTPPKENRVRIWHRHLKKNKIQASDELVNCLAENPKITPAIVSAAAKSIRLSGRPAAEIENVISGYAKAMGVSFKKVESLNPLENFNIELISADLPLKHLQRLATASVISDQSFCLFGPPGTGKSVYARYIAKSLDLPVVEKRASDLISKYVGETERNIALAFTEAKDSGAMLIFDEAESLLSSRSSGDKKWERSQVTEILICMEKYAIPFVCTTNMISLLDDASMRRFDHKIKFGFLSEKQTKNAFKLFFNMPSPKCLSKLNTLTPGDFRVVKRRCKILDINNADEIIELLRQECAFKQTHSRPIGFVSS